MTNREWTDLSAFKKHHEVQADVCVIGAGATGIYLTVELARLGHSVVLLEAGPMECVGANEIGFDAKFEQSIYAGATAGRYFGIGGSTSHWGGMLVPHTKRDLDGPGTGAETWPHIVDTVAQQAPQVLGRLGYEGGCDFETFGEHALPEVSNTFVNQGIAMQAALALPFRRRNFTNLLSRRSENLKPNVFFNAVAKSWRLKVGHHGMPSIKGVGAVSGNGNLLEVNARKFVLAAGAIESARILLEINEAGSLPVLRPTSAVGCYLADHLSMAIADVESADLGKAASLFAPRFSGAWMRKLRLLEMTPPPGAPRAFAHFIFSDSGKGFELAKELFGAMQARRFPAVSPLSAAAGVANLVQLAYNRFFKSLLYISKKTPVHLQLDIEQVPARGSCVNLSGVRDVFGRRISSIHWSVTSDDTRNISETARRILSKWPTSTEEIPRLRPRPFLEEGGGKPYDAYHPVGTCRMGMDREAVVDHELKVWGMENLWVTSTGILPSAGTANPTFSLLCLTHKLARDLGKS